MTTETDFAALTNTEIADLHQRLKVAAGHESYGVERAELDAQDPECAELARAWGSYDSACAAVQSEHQRRTE